MTQIHQDADLFCHCFLSGPDKKIVPLMQEWGAVYNTGFLLVQKQNHTGHQPAGCCRFSALRNTNNQQVLFMFNYAAL